MKNLIKTKSDFYLIDILKLFFSICVVLIHAQITVDMKFPLNYFLEKAVFRLAVPFFFITSGFFLASKFEHAQDIYEFKNISIKYTKKLLPMLIIFNLLNMLLCFERYTKGDEYYKLIYRLIRDLFFYPIGATWFLLACITGCWCLFFFYRINKQKLILPISIGLYSFALLCNSYFFVTEQLGLSKIFLLYMKIFESARNGFFCGFFFLYMGFIVRKKFKEWMDNNLLINKRHKMIVPLIILYSLYISELFLLKNIKFADDGSLFIFLPVFEVLFVLFCTTFISNEKIFLFYSRKASTIIYLIHSPILKICELLSLF